MFYHLGSTKLKRFEKMKIAVASDHGGFELKQRLVEYFSAKRVEIIKIGAECEVSCDYPDVAKDLAECIKSNQADWGIGICGTGVGISIALNRHKGIRAALTYSGFVAEMAKKHNNANVLCFGGRTMEFEDVVDRVEIFMKNEFEGSRHLRRIEKMDEEY